MNKTVSRDNRCFSGAMVVLMFLAFALVLVVSSQCGSSCPAGCVERKDTTIDTSAFVAPEGKNNIDLVCWAQMAYDNGWGYVYGTWGNVLTDSLLTDKAEQYAVDVGENRAFIRRHYMGGRVTDCIGLIKGYCWYSPSSGFEYCANGMPDIGANRLMENAVEKGEIATIPEIPGLAVWTKGHIGVYIGDGWVIEAMSTVEGIQKTRVEERPWTHWCRIPYIEYMENSEENS